MSNAKRVGCSAFVNSLMLTLFRLPLTNAIMKAIKIKRNNEPRCMVLIPTHYLNIKVNISFKKSETKLNTP